MCRFCLICVVLVGYCGGLAAAEASRSARPLLPAPGLDVDPAIPTLKKVTGHDWGQDISSHGEMERYLRALVQAAGDRAALVPYGKTYEGRTLYYLVLSSADNLRRREEIRLANLQLSDPRTATGEQASALISRLPALVWLTFAVHGNETSSTEAALLTAYHLLADRRPETHDLLQNVLLIIDPLQNPDGHERFVNVYRETRGTFPDAEPLAAEHQERWPGGRFNHYLFDLNRDWFLQSQRESQARVAAYLQWQPQLLVDAHEMGPDATYFFDPPADPISPFVLPRQLEWIDRLGRHLATRFDEQGFAFTTREMFDSFYPGYGSNWPIFQGGLAILWEQAGVRGLVIRREDERNLHFHEAVRHHYVSAIATVQFAATHREELLRDFYETRRRGVELGREGAVRHYFLVPDERAARARSLAQLLRNNGIEVRQLASPVKTTSTSIRSGEKAKRTIPAGSFHIPVAQPAGALVRVLLDRQVDMGEEFVTRQLERNKNRFADEIYDVTAWSLPLAFDVECLAAGETVEVDSQLWEGKTAPGQIAGGKARVAYLIADPDSALPALADWLRKGVRVHITERPLRLDQNEFPRGTLILKTPENPPELHAWVQQAARDYGLSVVAANTGFVSEGAHFGGPYVRWIRPPQIALVVDRPVSYSAGHTWYWFDQVLRYPVTRVAAQNLGRLKLASYNVLILPDGDYSGPAAPDEKEVARLRQWVSEGGTLVLVKGAAAWATREKVELLSVELRKKPAEPKKPAGEGKETTPAEAASRAGAESPDPSPGAFFRANVFAEHWLTFGCDPALDVFYNGNILFTPPDPAKARSLVTFRAEQDVLTSGFCWPQTVGLLAESPYVVHEPLGQGHIVAFADDPNFRAMYPGTQRLFANAVLFGPSY